PALVRVRRSPRRRISPVSPAEGEQEHCPYRSPAAGGGGVRWHPREAGPGDHTLRPQARRRVRVRRAHRDGEDEPADDEVRPGEARIAMDDEELDEIRRRKYAELQHAQEQAMVQAQAKEQVLAQRELILRQILTPEARERLARIELAYPDLTESIESQLIGLAQSGRVQRVIDDPTLRQILTRLIPKKREIKIERR